MKRSEISNYIKEVEGILMNNNFLLPPWASWAVNDWQQNKQVCENIMIVKEKQMTPFHFHWSKTEDIINRGGGRLIVELYNSDKNEEFTDTPVVFLTDGMRREVEAGGKVYLSPGESITLQTGVYQCFYAEEGSGTVMAGEVSMTNDDASDNRFHDNPGRFPKIIEDEVPYRLLVGDYSSMLGDK